MRLPKDRNSDIFVLGRKNHPVIPWEKVCFKANSFQKCRKFTLSLWVICCPAEPIIINSAAYSCRVKGVFRGAVEDLGEASFRGFLPRLPEVLTMSP